MLRPEVKQTDRVDFVRQSAYIALAMVLMQINEKQEPKVKKLRAGMLATLDTKGDTMTKFGAILGAGILDAGGRNVNITLLSSSGYRKMGAIVGAMMFQQYWYWYPLVHMLSLAFTPTAVLGLNANLLMPKNVSFRSDAPASTYAYPKEMEVKKEEKKAEVKKAVLSVTKNLKRKKKKRSGSPLKPGELSRQSSTASDVSVPASTTLSRSVSLASTSEAMDTSPDDGGDKKEAKEEAIKKEPEAPFEILSNPSRVTLAQGQGLTCQAGQRYSTQKKRVFGFVLLSDSTPNEAEEIVSTKAPKFSTPGVSSDEPDPPEPFEFTRYD
jgi:26S proteasome regulatory subunit N2